MDKQQNNKPHQKLKVFVYIFVRVILILTCILAFLAKSYFVSVQALLALGLFFLPSLIDHRFNIALPNVLEIIVILFIFSSVFLGEIQGYYEQYKHWDTMLHTSSGFLTAAIGFSLIDILNRHEKVTFSLSPMFVAIFAFCFSMTVGVIWEFYEFIMDIFLNFDMQKDYIINHMTSTLLNDAKTIDIENVIINGEQWNGYIDIGIIDTMKDLIVNAVGAVVFSIFGWLYIKGRGRRKWVENLMPRAKTNAEISLQQHKDKIKKKENSNKRKRS